MSEEANNQQVQEDVIDVGSEIMGWETWEFPPTDRSRRWYVVASAIGLFLLLYSLFTANFVFGIIVLMFAVLTIMRDLKRPDRLSVYITTAGVVFGNDFYRWEDIRDFSISYEPPDVKALYLVFHSRLQPMLSIDLEDMNPNEVRQAFLPYAFENLQREGESLTDVLRRVYKL